MISRDEPGEGGIEKALGLNRRPVRPGRRTALIAAVAVIVAVLMVIAVNWKGSDAAAVKYQTQAVREGDLTVIVTATGTLAATNSVDVGSELSGTAKNVRADFNDVVKAGQVLAELDTSKLEAQLTQSKAALEAARAKVLQAQATVKETAAKLTQYRKVRELSNNKVPSQAEFDAAEAALARAIADEANVKAAVAQAQAAVDATQTEVGKAVIRSPINGIVITRNIEPGQTLAASMTAPVLFTLAEDLTKMKLQVNVDEADVGQVKAGQNATFTVDAYPDRTFAARISQVRYGSTTVDGVVTYLTVLQVDNKDLSLRPGMTATAEITIRKVDKTLLAPVAALRFTPPMQQETNNKSDGLVGAILPHPPRSDNRPAETDANKKNQRVWILKEGRPVAVPVTVGASNGTFVQILAGAVKPGMTLLTDVMAEKQ